MNERPREAPAGGRDDSWGIRPPSVSLGCGAPGVGGRPFFARIARLIARARRRTQLSCPLPPGFCGPRCRSLRRKGKRRLRKPPLSIPILSHFPLSQSPRRANHEFFPIIRTKYLSFVPTESRERLGAPTGGKSPAQNFHQCHGLRGAVGPAGKERRAAQRALTRVGARCGASGKRLDAPCRLDSAALRVAPRRPPATSRASTVGTATLFGPLLADRTPGRDAGRDIGENSGLAVQCTRSGPPAVASTARFGIDRRPPSGHPNGPLP